MPDIYFLFQFTRTLVCQGHLTPLPLHVSPVYWAYDCGLRLYPLPDLVICADKHDPFNSSTLECTVMNPVSTIYSNILSVRSQKLVSLIFTFSGETKNE